MNVDKYGQAPAPMTLGPLPKMPADMPPELTVLKHLTGYTELELSNGDVIRIHLQVHEMNWDASNGTFVPIYRVVPEVIKRGWENSTPLPRPLS